MNLESEILEYEKNLQKCRDYRKRYLLVDNGKEIIEGFNANLIPNFNDFKSPFINEQLKFLKLITDLDFVNEHIIEAHEIWEKLISRSKETILYNTYYYKKLNKILEYIILDLKHFIDEIISSISVIRGEFEKNKIFISSIGDYLGKRNNRFNYFDDFKEWFQKIDDLANSYKH